MLVTIYRLRATQNETMAMLQKRLVAQLPEGATCQVTRANNVYKENGIPYGSGQQPMCQAAASALNELCGHAKK